MVIKFWVRKEKHKKAKRSFKLAKNLLITASILLALLVPVSAVPMPPIIENLPAGSFLYTFQPYWVLSADPTVTEYRCEVGLDPSYAPTIEDVFQINIGANPNTIQQATLVNLTTGVEYHVHCKANDGTGYSPYGPDTTFTIVEGFNNKCQPSSEGVFTGPPEAYYSVYPMPEDTTPINRTIFHKKTGLTYGYAGPNVTAINLEVDYNDTVWLVTDSYDLTNFGEPSLATLKKNDYSYMSPIDSHNTADKKYFVDFKVTTPSFPAGNCSLTYGYALNINPNLEQDTGDAKGATIISLTALLIGLLAFLGGRRG